MQWNSANPGKLSGWGICTILLAGLPLMLLGCGGSDAPPAAVKSRQAYADVKISIACRQPEIANVFVQRSAAWRSRTGAQLQTVEPETADVVIIPVGELGRWVANRAILAIPEDFRNSAHTLQWSRLLSVWSDRLASWGGTAYGIPLAGESYVLAYRSDRLAELSKRLNRTIPPPATWEDYAEVAELFLANDKASLPVLNDEQALREFHFIAACFERLALSGTDFNKQMHSGGIKDSSTVSMLSFHHDVETSEPRIQGPAFVEAAKLFKRLAACRIKTTNPAPSPVQSLNDGSAALAILSLAELGKIERRDGAANPAIGLAPLPGTKVWIDPVTGERKPPGDKVRSVNFVPYFGTSGWLGVVRSTCANPEAAFDLLAELSSLERSTELLSDPTLGFGPFRIEHLDQARESIWLRYGFDVEKSRLLIAAIRQQTGSSLANPVIGIRGSDRDELLPILARELSRLSTGEVAPEAAMANVHQAWKKLDAQKAPDVIKNERRQSAGIR